MDSTELLFYQDVNKREFDATILKVDEIKRGWEVVLDRTGFYPEGGGQPADKGTIADIPVLDVKKQGGEIIHILPQKPDGEIVRGKIDWDWRYDYMQQHSGQHILSAVFYKDLNYNTVSVHQGTDYTTIEFDVENISDDEIKAAETKANRIISQNLPIRVLWTDDEGLSKYNLRRPAKKKGSIRIVKIEGIDTVACGGLHTGKTGDVGLVKSIGQEKIRGHARLYWKIGKRAFEDYREKTGIISALNVIFSAQQEELIERVNNQSEEIGELKKTISGLEDKLAHHITESAVTSADTCEKLSGGRNLVFIELEEESKSLPKKVIETIIKRGDTVGCVFAPLDGGFRWMIGMPEGETTSLKPVLPRLLEKIQGKGGGKPPLWQGSGSLHDRKKEFFRELKDFLES